MNLDYTVIGESTFLFTIGNYKILTDPWFGESIYGGGWTQYPFPKISMCQLSDITHIFISHVHPDHCCIHSIKKIFKYSPQAKLIIMDRGESPCFLSKKLSRAFDTDFDKRCTKLKPYVEFNVGELSLWCLPPSLENSLNEAIDSSLLLACPDGLILFSNDNLPTLEHARFINSLDINQYIALIPFSGGSGYPSSYRNMSFEQKVQAAANIRADYEKIAEDFLVETDFDYFMPVAGNHILTSKSYDFHTTTSFLQNPYTAIKNVDKIKVSSTGVYAEPGCNIVAIDTILTSEIICSKEKSFEFQRRHFIESVSSRIIPDVSHFDGISPDKIVDAFTRYSQRLQSCISDISLRFPNELPMLVLTCAGVSLCIDKHSLIVNSIESNAYENIVDSYSNHSFLLCVDFKPNLLNAIIQKALHINEADAACLLTYYRTMPYIPELYTVLFTTIH